MAKILLVLFAFCVVPSIVAVKFNSSPFLLKGSAYCDTCLCGYETSASKPLPGAVVRLECRRRVESREVTYTKEAVTDSGGKYEMVVQGDRGDDVCDVMLVKSSDPECSKAGEGRDRARVVLTRNNGMSSSVRFANPMGFVANTPLASCGQILKQYEESEEEE